MIPSKGMGPLFESLESRRLLAAIIPNDTHTLAEANAAETVSINVINVGATRSVKTLDAALAKAVSGDTIMLDAETFTVPATMNVKQDNLTITSAGAATIKYNPTISRYTSMMNVSGDNVVISNLNFSVGGLGAWTITCGKWQVNTTIKHCTFGGTAYHGVQLLNAKGVTVDDCTFNLAKDYAIYSGGLKTDRTSSGLVVRNSKFFGSTEHVIRIHGTQDVLIEGCEIHNEWDKYNSYHGAGLNLRDGSDFIVRDTVVYGSIGVGPLSSSPLSVWLKNISFINVTEYGAYFNVETQVQNLQIHGMKLIGMNKSGNAFNIQVTPGRAQATGTVDDVEWQYVGGSFGKWVGKTPLVFTNIRPYLPPASPK
jgi:hypothetical protein